MNETTTRGILSASHVGGGFAHSCAFDIFPRKMPDSSGMHSNIVVGTESPTVVSPPFAHVVLLTESVKFLYDAVKGGMRRKLEGCVNLSVNWDGNGGHAPAKADIGNAIQFMDSIPAEYIFSAGLMVAGDGDVGFEWDMKDRCLEIGFCDGNISFYGKMPPEREVKGDFRFVGGAPENLAEFMEIFFRR